MTTYRKQSSKRFLISLVISIIFHGLIFTLMEYYAPFGKEKPPEIRGPIYVTLEPQESSVIAPVKVEKKIIPEPVEKEELKLLTREPVKEKLSEQTTLKAEQKKEITPPEKPAFSAKPSKAAESPASGLPYRKTPPASPEVKTSSLPRGTVIEEYTITELPGYEEAEETVYSKKLDPEALAKRHLTLKGEESKQAPTFSSRVEVESAQSSLDLESLDRALEKTGEESGSEKSLSTVSVAGGDTEGIKADAGVEVPERIDIVWDQSSSERKLLFSPPRPDVPSWVKNEGLDLEVVVRFSVTPEGNTTGVEIERPSGSSGFSDVDTSVIEAVRKLKFMPVDTTKLATGKITYIISTR